jgi:vitamin B12 transporter
MRHPVLMSAACASLAALGAAQPALAQPAASTPAPAPNVAERAETIVVTASRIRQPARAVGSSVTVVSGAEIDATQAVAVTDVLRTAPGISINRNGGPGSVASVRLRGAEAEQTVLLVDGVKLADPSQPGGGTDFGALLTGDLERIEVLRGPQSTLYGNEALGGVVALYTRDGSDGPGGSFDAEVGDLDTWLLRGSVRGSAGLGTAGPVRYALAASHFDTGGISAAAAGTEADSFTTSAARARVSAQVTDRIGLEARLWWSDADVGIDGFPAPLFVLADTPERSQTEQLIGYLGATLALLEGRWRTVLSYAQATVDRTNSNPALAVPTTFLATGDTDTLALQTTLELTPRVTVLAGYEQEATSIRTASPSSFTPNPVPFRANAEIAATYVELQARPTGWLSATLGARHSDHDRFGGAVNLRATLAATLPDGRTTLRAAIADGFKAPSLFQLFSNFGNSTLKPEEAASVEAGIDWALDARGTLSAGLTAFARDTVNQIDFVSCFGVSAPICVNRPFGTYDNVARTRAEGIEATAGWAPLEGLRLDVAHTRLEALNRAGGTANFGRDLPRRPRSTTSATLSWRSGFGLDLSATATRVGSSFDNASNSRRLEGYTLVTLRAQQALGEVWSVVARMENAGDETYQTTSFYGSPPRQAFVGLRARF